jgi:hypothetical protein
MLTYRDGSRVSQGDLVQVGCTSDWVFRVKGWRFEGAVQIANTAPGFIYGPSSVPVDQLRVLTDQDLECWCTDAERDYRIAAVYCPRCGDEPDHSLSCNPERSRLLRAALDAQLRRTA